MSWGKKIHTERENLSLYVKTTKDVAIISGISTIIKLASNGFSHPFDVVRQIAQASPDTYKYLVPTIKELGLQGLYRGYSLTLLHSATKQFVYRTPLMTLASNYDLNILQSSFLMASGEFLFGMPINRLKTLHITGEGSLRKNFSELFDKDFKLSTINNFCRGAKIKAPLDFIGWTMFYTFDKQIKLLAKKNDGSLDYKVIFSGYCVVGSACEFLLSPIKVSLAQVQRYNKPLENRNLLYTMSHISKTQGFRVLYAGSVPSAYSAVTKLLSGSAVQEIINKAGYSK